MFSSDIVTVTKIVNNIQKKRAKYLELEGRSAMALALAAGEIDGELVPGEGPADEELDALDDELAVEPVEDDLVIPED